MHFLTDYENLQDKALAGVECLLPEDHLYIFYSKNCDMMSKPHFDQIISSGCDIQLILREKPQKNGNDFYIASKVAEIAVKHPGEEIAIISNDTDFMSIKDYWMSFAEEKQRIYTASDVGAAILQVPGRQEQKKQIQKARERVHFAEELAKKKNSLENKLMQKVGPEKTEKILELQSASPKAQYLGCMKICGRITGQEVYRMTKATRAAATTDKALERAS